MPIIEDGVREYLRGVACRLEACGRGGREAVLDQAEAFLGWSRATVYRHLRERAGWTSGRKARADKGATRQSEESLELIASIQKPAVRKNGKATLHTPSAVSIAAVNGAEIAVTPGRINRLLKDRRLNVAVQKRARPVQEMRALHPNHVHQVDPSLCLIYYLKGKQHIIREDEFYKNKLEGVAEIRQKVWRYVLWDAASSVIVPWYVEAAGETQDNLFRFLMHAWGRQSGRPFHGVPRILVWDKGSANGAAAIRSLLRALQVQDIPHAKGNPRAKGGVEGANNIVETHFECRLRFQPVASVEELNRAADAWANAYNADLIPHEDCRLRRDGLPRPMARYDLWLRITESQLRCLPPVEVCQALMEGKPVTRKVADGLKISYKHPRAQRTLQYDVSGLAGVCVGDTVAISPLVYGECPIMIRVERYDGEPLEYVVTPETEYDEFGQPLSGAVWGQEFKSKPDTEVERQGKALDRRAYPGRTLAEIQKAKDKNATPFEGHLDTIDHLQRIDVPAYLAKRGSEITVPDRARVEVHPLTHIQALKSLVVLLGRAVSAEENALVRAGYPDGVPEEALNDIAARLAGEDLQTVRLQAVK